MTGVGMSEAGVSQAGVSQAGTSQAGRPGRSGVAGAGPYDAGLDGAGPPGGVADDAAAGARPAVLRLEPRVAPGQQARRSPPTRGRLARRRVTLTAVKWLLPLGALLLLGAVALWPELSRVMGSSRLAMRGLAAVELGTGRMVQPRYRGVDARGRPYTVTADSAKEAGPERVDLVAPKGDVVMQNGAWLMLEGRDGVYMQHTGQLDLSGDVTLYRQDGTVMTSDTADVDLKQDSAASNDRTHAEGPFGTLDAQGFVLVDKGAVIQFQGPAHMVLNGGSR
jgi:lipopolysaccharide export system protein LptC